MENKQFDMKTQRMVYQKNSSSYSLALLAIVLNAVAFIISYEYRLSPSSIKPNLLLGFDIVVNIIFLLSTFLTAEKIKVYDYKFSIGAMGLGIFNILRIFVFPLISFNNGYLNTILFFIIGLLYALSGVLLIFAGIICYKKHLQLKEYLAISGEVM